MNVKRIAFLLPVGALLAMSFLLAGEEPRSTLAVPDNKTMTVLVECGDENKLDMEHRIDLTVTGPDAGAPSGTKTVKIHISCPADTTSEAIAGAIASRINRSFELTSPVTVSETRNPALIPPKGSSEFEAEDVNFPNDVSVDDISVEKKTQNGWAEKFGKLKLCDSHSRHPYQGPTPPEDIDFDKVTIGFLASSAEPLGIQFYAEGVRSSTLGGFDLLNNHTFPVGTSVPEVVYAIGDYAESLGMTASYPDPNTVEIDTTASDYRIVFWSFTAFEDEPSSPTGDPVVQYFTRAE